MAPFLVVESEAGPKPKLRRLQTESGTLNIPKLEWNNPSLIREISKRNSQSEMDFQLYQSVNVFWSLMLYLLLQSS